MKYLLALLISLPALACDLNFPQYGVCGTVRWTQGPVLATESKLEIEFSPALEGITLKVDAWMNSMGHGTRPVEMVTRADGVVEISKLYLVMNGLWSLRVFLNDSSNFMEKAEMPIHL